MSDFCVCVLAHNEEKHIASTVRSILQSITELNFEVFVYANGCTDNTVSIVKELCEKEGSLHLFELAVASKVNAWNIAFHKHDKYTNIFFSDGDILLDPDALQNMVDILSRQKNTNLVCCELWPHKDGLNIAKKLVGFMQIPFRQDFLTGTFYAVTRKALDRNFARMKLDEIPVGIVAEDRFIEDLIPREEFLVCSDRVYYEPPAIDDYCRYQARLRWQNEQIEEKFSSLCLQNDQPSSHLLDKTAGKLKGARKPMRLFFGMCSVLLRYCFKILFREKIEFYYKKLGEVNHDGTKVLTEQTRSMTTK